MNKMSKYIFGIPMILMLLSCRTQKPVIEVNETAREWSANAGPDAVFKTRHSFRTMKIKKMNIDFMINGMENSFKGNMAIHRDSLIVISIIPMFGYEAVRIMCTKDSAIVINRTEKTYHASSLEYFMKKYHVPAGFEGLQAVLTNEAFLYKSSYPDIENRKEVREENGRLLYLIESLLGSITLSSQKITSDTTRRNINDMSVYDYQKNMGLSVWYSEFSAYGDTYFPEQMKVELRDTRNIVSIDIGYGLIIFDDPVNAEFSVPDNYVRVYL
jgi:hypothetical protein